jgi:hypothetical protein
MKGEPRIIKLLYVLMAFMVIGCLWFMFRG